MIKSQHQSDNDFQKLFCLTNLQAQIWIFESRHIWIFQRKTKKNEHSKKLIKLLTHLLILCKEWHEKTKNEKNENLQPSVSKRQQKTIEDLAKIIIVFIVDKKIAVVIMYTEKFINVSNRTFSDQDNYKLSIKRFKKETLISKVAPKNSNI